MAAEWTNGVRLSHSPETFRTPHVDLDRFIDWVTSKRCDSLDEGCWCGRDREHSGQHRCAHDMCRRRWGVRSGVSEHQ